MPGQKRRYPFCRQHQMLMTTAALAIMVQPVFGDAKTIVRIRIIDSETGQTTPAMVCITGSSNGDVRLPGAGEICKEPSKTDTFYRGVLYHPGRNWVGPVRKTQGRGNNDDRSYVYELRPSIPYWAEPVMYQTSGDFTIDLPEGKWRLAVERGMEYIPVVQEFTTTGQETAVTQTVEMKRWIHLAKRGWWSGDVHVHHPSLKPEHREYLLQYAVAEDLHLLNLLEMGDHQGTEFKQAGFGAPFRVGRDNYWLIPGQEEPRSTFGHIIGVNTNRLSRVENIADYDFYDLVFRDIHKQPGALVGFAHLSWNGCNLPRGMPWYVTTGEIDFVEVLQLSTINTMGYYDYLNLGFKLTAAAGSDVPWGSTIGEVRTYACTRPGRLDPDEWFSALKKGRTFVSNGPAMEFTVDQELPGSEIARSVGQRVNVVARAWGHPAVGLPKALSIVSNEGVVREVVNDASSTELSLEIEVPIDQSRWLVASTVCHNNAVAHSTPVYVIVDGRPTWSPSQGPLVIDSQLRHIQNIEQEFNRNAGHHGRGVHERLDKAKVFYKDLRQKMMTAQRN